MSSKMQQAAMLPTAKCRCQNFHPQSPIPTSSIRLILFALALSLLATHSTALSFGRISIAAAEPAFVRLATLPIRSRAFVGIRTLPSSKAIFGARQLKERLMAEQAEQRREQRQAAFDQEQEQQSDEQEQRRQRIIAYDRLLCMAALQNLAQCKDI